MDFIKSEKAKEILGRSYDGGHISMSNAISAVEAAEKDVKEKCEKAFRSVMSAAVLGNAIGEPIDIEAEFRKQTDSI